MEQEMSEEYTWLNESSRRFLESGYLSEGETPEERIKHIADTAENILGIPGFSDKFQGYMKKGWISLSSPVWANFGKKRGAPISCFSSYVGDSIGEIMDTVGEVGMMSKLGGGTSGYFGDVRPRGSGVSDNGKTSGVVHFLELFQTVTDVVSQGGVRRGRFAPYLPIDHGDIEEYLDIGTEGHPIQTLTYGVSVTSEWIESMRAGDKDKRRIWGKLLKRRTEVGYPYIFFHDNANKVKADVYEDIEITNSQLCTEILLPINKDESFVCNLASVNLLHYDEYKDTDLVETLVFFLDAVVSEFISKLEDLRDSEDHEDNLSFYYMRRSYEFAKNHRALGLGVLGLHSYYQKNSIPFVSEEASKIVDEMFCHLKESSYTASEKLAEMFGECKMTKGTGRRNTTLNAVAPTTSSAFILGQVSQSIEPLMSNYYIKDLSKMKFEVKNKFLEKVLEKRGYNTLEVWQSIAKNDGSVQHLGEDVLSEHEKEVFLTFCEMDQKGLIEQASIRQKHLDQTQSVNIMVSSSATPKEVNEITLLAHDVGLPTLYYQHSTNAAQQFIRKATSTVDDSFTCTACEL